MWSFPREAAKGIAMTKKRQAKIKRTRIGSLIVKAAKLANVIQLCP